jgi:hypothetical protein
MQFRTSALTLLAIAASTSAFVPANPAFVRNGVAVKDIPAIDQSEDGSVKDIPAIDQSEDGSYQLSDIDQLVTNYVAGGADTDFARKYRHLVGANIKTVAQSFAEFTEELGFSVNALYKNMVTDLVQTTHLIVVCARFTRDPVWSLGMMTALDLLLKNYPEKDVAERIVSSLFKCIGMDEAEVRAEAASIEEWAQGKSKAEIEAAFMTTEDGNPLGKIAAGIKEEEFWMYSRYFGLGLVRIMDVVGVEMDKDEVYPVMEDWMTQKLGRPSLTACNDSDMYFKVKAKLDMMETMMKEVEIREKKRMAERLEEKAEQALRAAEREEQYQAKVDAEKKPSAEIESVDA